MMVEYSLLNCYNQNSLWFPVGVDNVDYTLYPSKEFQLKYLQTYLEEAAILRGVDKLVVVMSQCYIVCSYSVKCEPGIYDVSYNANTIQGRIESQKICKQVEDQRNGVQMLLGNY